MELCQRKVRWVCRLSALTDIIPDGFRSDLGLLHACSISRTMVGWYDRTEQPKEASVTGLDENYNASIEFSGRLSACLSVVKLLQKRPCYGVELRKAQALP